MSTLRWTPEMLAAHTAKLRKAVESAPVPVGPIATVGAGKTLTSVARSMLDVVAVAKKPRKYRNTPTTDANGVRHASKKQATRYRDLGLLLKSGAIEMLAREVRFRLPGGVEYHADHVTATPRGIAELAKLIAHGDLTIEDVKSEATRKNPVYRLKRKQMQECLGLRITEV